MALIDVVLLVLVALAAWTGWRIGAVRTALGLAGGLLGLVVGLLLASWIATTSLSFGTRVLAELAAVLAGVVVVGGVGSAISHRAVRPYRRPVLVDRLLGAGLRGVVALVLGSLVVQGLVLWATPGSDSSNAAATKAGSWLGGASWVPRLPAVVDTVRAVLPTDLTGIVPSTSRPSDTPVYISGSLSSAVLKVTGDRPGSTTYSVGSGFVVSGQRVVTAYHVVRGTDRVVVSADGRQLPATVEVADQHNDIAVLHVAGLSVAPLTVASAAAQPGAAATVVGYPYGGRQRARNATIVGGVAIPVGPWSEGGAALRPGYRLATQVRPGNSGGPLVDSSGQVVGIIDSRSMVDPDVGFAITAEPLRADLARAS